MEKDKPCMGNKLIQSMKTEPVLYRRYLKKFYALKKNMYMRI